MKTINIRDLYNTVVHHHEQCINRALHDVAIINKYGEVNEKTTVECTCDQVMTTEELNELLEV